MKLDKFVLALFIAVAVAWFFPQFGSAQSGIPLNAICTAGIALIFFFYGVKLNPEKIKSGLKTGSCILLSSLPPLSFALCLYLLLIRFCKQSSRR